MKVIKTNLGEVNKGSCRSKNNCRFTGKTIVWAIVFDDFENDDSFNSVFDHTLVAVNTKRAATAICEWLNTQDREVGKFDPVLAFIRAKDDAGTAEGWMFDIKEV